MHGDKFERKTFKLLIGGSMHGDKNEIDTKSRL